MAAHEVMGYATVLQANRPAGRLSQAGCEQEMLPDWSKHCKARPLTLEMQPGAVCG